MKSYEGGHNVQNIFSFNNYLNALAKDRKLTKFAVDSTREKLHTTFLGNTVGPNADVFKVDLESLYINEELTNKIISDDQKHGKEEQFYANKNFAFSYSSLNKLLFSPSLFYKDYILQDREIRTDKHLVEGKLVHCLVFEPENLNEKFNVVPGKAPSDSVRKILKTCHYIQML